MSARRIDVHIDARRISDDKKKLRRTVVAVQSADVEDLNSTYSLEPTNNYNEAKYLALIKALENLKAKSRLWKDIEQATIHSDCWLMVNQYNKESEVKDPRLLKFKNRADELANDLKFEVEVRYIPRSENQACRIFEKEVIG